MSRRLLTRLAAVVIVLAVSGAVIGGAAHADEGVFATALVGMNIRGGPSVSFEKLGVLPAGESVQLDGRARGWVRFTFPDTLGKGWLSLGGLQITGDLNTLPDASHPDLVVVATPPVDGPATGATTIIGIVPPPPNSVIGTTMSTMVIRGGPGIQFERLGTLQVGQSIVLDGRSGGWFRFSFPNSFVKGWLSGTLLKVTGDLASLPSVTFPPDLTPTP
jgi:uncharacterized protein YraI